MKADMQQGNFSHAKCQACGHMALIDKFNPTLVDLQDCNLPNISFEVTETKDSPVKLQTVNMNCPICTSPFVEAIFPNEVN